jgi:anti-sigma factor (TIGR02949 family)
MSPLARYTCLETFQRLDDFVDHELSEEEQRLVQEHLATCEMCAGEYRFEASVLDQVRAKIRRIMVPSGLIARVSARLSAGRDAEGPSGD